MELSLLEPGLPILEIGPGTGSLTSKLLEFGSSLSAIEIDNELCLNLQNQFKENLNFKLICGDASELDWDDILSGASKWQLVSNLPYHLSSILIFKMIYARHSFSKITLLLQKEFAHRLISKPNIGAADIGSISIIANKAFECKKLLLIKGSSFYPPAAVDSSLVQLIPRPQYALDEYKYNRFVQEFFSFRRKKIGNSCRRLHKSVDWDSFDQRILDLRPENLDIQNWDELYLHYVNHD